MALLPFEALEEVSKVLGFGAEKYSIHNWRGGFDWSRLQSAALRHLSAHIQGVNKDEETGLSHVAHATSCLLFLLAHELNGYGTDDRHKPVKRVKRGAMTAAEQVLELCPGLDLDSFQV